MKNKSKLLSLVVVLVLVVAFALVACVPQGNQPNDPQEGTCTVVVGEKAYSVDLSKVTITEGLFSVLDYLKDTQGLTYSATNGYLNSIDSLANNYETSEYIYIYTSVKADFDVSDYATTEEYNDVTLTSSGVGGKEMHIEKDCVILITLIKW